MGELRVVLLFVGLVLIALIVGFEWWRRRPPRAVTGGREKRIPAAFRDVVAGVAGQCGRGLSSLVSGVRRAAEGRSSGIAGNRKGRARVRQEPSLGRLTHDGPAGVRASARGGSSEEPPVILGDIAALADAASEVEQRDPRNGSGRPPRQRTGTGKGPGPGREGAEAEIGKHVVVLTLMARAGEQFEGTEIRHALEMFDLEYGRMGLFHHFAGRSGSGASPVFSVANVLEPGTFDLDRLAALRTPGICLFLQLPGPLEGTLALDVMLDVARNLARELGGELRDAERGTLTSQGVARLREEVVEHALRAPGAGEAGGSRVLH